MCGYIMHDIIIARRDLRRVVDDDFEAVLKGQRIKSLIRRGKYIIAICDNGCGFVLHLGMSGRIAIHAPDDVYTPVKHDHAVFTMESGHRIVFNDPRRFGMLYLISAETWREEVPFSKMGEEPLADDLDVGAFCRMLRGKKAPIKAALLDQRVIAGLGNIYVCEALYRSGILPTRLSKDIGVEEADDLLGHIRDVLREAIASGGSSLRDHKQTDGSMGYFQHHFDVYGKEGESCGRCDSICIKRIVQSGRSSFFCANTQS